jgi:predicted amidohydrolase
MKCNMPTLKTAAIQLNSQPNLDINMTEVYRWLERAATKGAKLICLPENFAFMGNESERMKQAEEIAKIVEESLRVWAEELDVYILAGGYPVPAEEGKVFNRSILINPKGEIQAMYNKIHLFDVELSADEVYRESDMVQGGREVVVSKLKEFEMNLGLSICYDIRFPELYRQQADRGVDIITVTAAFTRPTGHAHWEILLRARAIENSAYVIAPAQTGKHGSKRETWGHAMMIDPWGRVLSKAGTEPGMAFAEIDSNVIAETRKKLPSLEHRIL